uniref:immunoglobulin superfamily member 3-like n=1 Tax=Centroberyx gerrardi TaxID=166262 RepID=UPI003AADE937
MRHSLQSVWATVLFCLGLLTSHCGEARVLTEAQSGPLYRVLGYPLSISCNVSGFPNQDTRKEFQFRMFRPERATEINIISTNDQDFSYAVYMKRVFNNEITLENVLPNSVLFKIKHLEERDEGDYECFVINPEQTYDGIYSVKTTVKVIDNSLIISSPVSASLSHDEGNSLTLTCQASSNTVQHTHLSVTWYLHKDGEDNAHPIISLERDLTLSPGQGFEGRYQAGLIGLDKVGEATYRLNMAQLELSDQGKIYCQAQEWIQDPDRSWYSIAQKSAEATTLNVKAKEVVDKGSLVVRVSAQQATLQEGQELSLSCSVDAQNLAERFFSVAWLRENVELARIGPTGVVSVGPEYSGREKEGELRATRTGNKDHRLILRPVRTQDQGEYVCRAWPQDRGADGAFTQGAAQDSSSQLVTVSATESGLSVEMEEKDVSVNEGDGLKLTCKVGGVKGQLSVTWEHKSPLFSNVISLSQEGVMEVGEEFRQRSIMAMRPAADTFTLELNEVRQADAGVYQCTVSEWTITSNGKVQKTNSQSQTGTVSVVLTESFLKVSLRSRNTLATVGEEVELLCRLRGPRLPMTLTWSLQRENASSPDNILTLYPNGNINWSGDQRRYQVKTESSQNEVYQTLLIMGASHREAGRYQCEVSVILESRYKKLPPSNLLAVMVKNPVSELSLTSTPTVERNINTDIDIKCSVIKATSPLSRFAVTWLVQRQAENKTILSSNRDAVVTFGAQVESSHGQRISMKRSEGPSFELTIRQARIGDSGLYMCKVVEWLQDPRGQWYELPPVSTTTELQAHSPANDLRCDKTEQQVEAGEGEEVELTCALTSGASSPSSRYSLTWLYTGSDPSVMKVPLVELDHSGLLRYPDNQGLRGLQGRLRLSRPTHSSFHLGIQRAREGDSGTYQCQVEQYQLDHQGGWQQKASDDSGPITLSVKATENNLIIVKDDVMMNVTGSQNFTIPCHISTQSSQSSVFQVTWFWQKESGIEQHPIFTAYRNSTLQDRSGRGERLRFGHPVPNHFNLTVFKPVPADSGLYFCEVEEWLLSLSQGWRKVAAEKSGKLTVSVYIEGGDVSEQVGTQGIMVGVLTGVIICLLVVVFLLALKVFRGSGAKKPDDSLWAEEHPLKPKPSAED